ncbi:PAS domain-containing sensor histidine kinase [Ectothiorhodospira lacustris]|uniref:PAS domain-containing sensor histidine kinase n=1 Tax=Ectothiorhodospira lacustris TaxID=2899127 RepID=UPI001EE8FFD0|nr:PAS domain-containing sensor histidine kinase [Ectothiorhodospira lacustris]MCG5522553.1 PAS domain-containing sensor histidine kinase [Ectothiorhodospira lacustris]
MPAAPDCHWMSDLCDALMLLDGEGTVHRWSDGAEFMFGYTGAEAVDASMDELVVIQDRRDEQRRFIADTLLRGHDTFETLRRRKDGTLIYVDITGKVVNPSTTPTEQRLLFSEKDVTSLKVERDSKTLEARFRELLESTPDGIVIVNPTGHILIANSQAERLFAYGPGEMRATVVERLLPERFRAAHKGHRAHYFAQPRTRSMGAGLELYGLRKDGTEFPVEISLSPIRTEETPLVMSAIRDVSERKLFEQALREKNIELEKANLAKDRFLASMSHELRTPLNAVIGFTGTLLMKLPGDLNDEQTHQLEIVRSNAMHLLSLINDLLHLAKIEAGKIELNREPTDCCTLLNEVAASLEPQALAKGLALIVDVPPGRVVVDTDRRALNQILLNLANNAIKFTAAGHVRLELLAHESGARRGIQFAVEDTGPGMSEDEQAALFGAFVQGQAAKHKGVEGTGLGLHLSRKLAELLGGQLNCHSIPDQGSRFVLSLWEASP